MQKRMTLALFASLFLLTGLGARAQQNPEAQAYRLNKVDINGLEKISREKFLEVSGLTLGQSLKFADLKTATNKLVDSGLFANVRYRYSWDGDNLDVIFEVEESKSPEPGPAPAAPKTLVLGKIAFSGLKRCDETTAVAAVGLQLGAVYDQKQLVAATKRLGDAGYFSDVNYTYGEMGGQMVAQFNVTEFEWDVFCLFDNFIWFTPQELRDAVRKQIPGFEGAVADHVAFPTKIKSALEELLRQRGIKREVDFIVGVRDMDAQGSKIQKQLAFVSTGAPMPVCNVSFPGASVALGKQLQSEIKQVVNLEYSVEYSGRQFAQYIENTLLPVYRRRGYLKAKFGDVSAQPDAGANKKCKGGVNVSAPVVEGAVYKLGKFEWEGNQALEVETIQDLFRMKTGITADGAKIDKGLNAIKTAYLKQGYLDLKMTIETNFDESAGVANYHIVVDEGKPYQMGEVLIKNASEDEEKRIRGKWQMAQGAVFNVEYVRSFIKKMFDDRGARTPRAQLQPDRAKQIANVLFTF
jgi:outer membrane protein assembly factor BamA